LGWVVYMLKCKTGELYTGSTNDIERRLREHNQGRGAKFTRSRLPVALVYREEQNDKSQALRRENEIKAMDRRGKLLLVRQTAFATSA